MLGEQGLHHVEVFFRPPNGLFSCPDCDRGFFQALETLRRGPFSALETHYSFVSDPAGPLGGGGGWEGFRLRPGLFVLLPLSRTLTTTMLLLLVLASWSKLLAGFSDPAAGRAFWSTMLLGRQGVQWHVLFSKGSSLQWRGCRR